MFTRKALTHMADIIYLEDRKPFDFNEEPCEHCPPKIKNSCSITCEKAQKWFNKLADLLGEDPP